MVPETKATIKTIYVIDDEEEESLLSYGEAIALGVMKMSQQVKEMRIRRVKLSCFRLTGLCPLTVLPSFPGPFPRR